MASSMEFNTLERPSKNRRSSFWKHLPGFSRKSKPEQEFGDQDITLISANKLHSSFRSLSLKKTSKDPRKEHGGEPSKDGTFVLTSDNQLRWGSHNEAKNRHVQFAPTPNNKYHVYRETPGGDKENVDPVVGSKNDTLDVSCLDYKNESSLLKDPRCDESVAKPTTLPRTSTKSNLGSGPSIASPDFDVSCIRRNSLGSRDDGKRLQDAKSDESIRFSSVFVGHTQTSRVTESDLGIPFVPRMKPAQNMAETNGLNETTVREDAGRLRASRKQLAFPERADQKPPCGCKKTQIVREKCEEILKEQIGLTRNPRQLLEGNKPQPRHAHSSERHLETAPVVHVFGPSRPFREIPPPNNCPNIPKPRDSRLAERPIAVPPIRSYSRSQSCYQFNETDSQRRSFRAPSNPQFPKNAFLSFRAKSKPPQWRSTAKIPTTATAESFKYCDSKKDRRYDGMSSLADDECSLNCSCYECLDGVSARREEARLIKSESFKSRLFFPEAKEHSKELLREEPPSSWYECNDTMCQTPETGSKRAAEQRPQTEKNKMDKGTSYEKEDVLIADDYEINPEGTDLKENTPAAAVAKSSKQVRPRSSYSSGNEDRCFPRIKTISRCSSEMSPNSKKLSESCVFALQETLKNLLHDTSSKTSFTISSFDSSSSVDKPGTILIQIQNNFNPSDPRKNALTEGGQVLDKTRDSPLSRTRSMPEMYLKPTKEESEFKGPSNAVQGPEDQRNTERTSSGPSTQAAAGDQVLDIESNSGYSTVSSCLSLHQNDEDSALHDKRILEELVRIGKGLPPLNKTPKKTTFVVSSPKKTKFKAKDVLSGRAKLKLNIYNNCGMITVHVVKAVKLASVRTMKLNPYVKVSLHPDDTLRVHWRTNVIENDSNPVFDQKFSFEIMPEDAKKRLIFSVWHRDREKKRSEFLGCMSFGVYHVMGSNQSLSGWYRLLKEVVGTKKHFAAGQAKSLTKLLAR